MKANELMIGDWVSTDDGFAIITTIAMDGAFLKDKMGICAASFDRINPIPLTAEILEKNGFTRLGTSYILKGEHFGLNNPSNPSNYLDNYWLRISIKAVNIEYVHELQHSLRICGLKDVANNFNL